MVRTLITLVLCISLTYCGDDSSSDTTEDTDNSEENGNESEESTESGNELSAAFLSLGCASSSCHGPDGKRESTSLNHGDDGLPVTNLSTSKRTLTSWTTWIRTGAKSPMPTYTSEQYSDSDLQADYTVLTGRTE